MKSNVIQFIHQSGEERWFRLLKSDLLPEVDTLTALAHIAGCTHCLEQYDAVDAYAPGEFEAESRKRREEWLQSRLDS